jgi:parallel beta-helix repeat protein
MSNARRSPLTLTILIAIFAIALLAVLALGADDAEAGGSGDYPPPASGHWYIYQSTSVWSENIVMRGNIYIYAPITFNIVNITFDCTYNLQYGLYVYNSGSLSLNNGNITATSGSYHYRFQSYNTTTIRNCELSEAYYGLEVFTKDFTITDSKVFHMYGNGLYMYLTYTLKGNVLIKGNEFVDNRYNGIYTYQIAYLNRVTYDAVMTGDVTIQNNKLKGNLGGAMYIYRRMYAYYSHQLHMLTNLTIEGNEMTDNRGPAVYVHTRFYNYQGGSDGIIRYQGSVNVNNNTIRDNSAYQAVYYYNDVDVRYGADAIIDSDVNMVGNIVTENQATYAIYFNNNIYEYYGRDARIRIDVRMEANNISKNGGHGVYINSYTNTNHGGKGVCTNDGDLIFKDNNILDNEGTGVYLYRYAFSSYAANSSIYSNTTFTGNTVRNNQGYGGTYLYSYAYKARGDPNGTARVYGDVHFENNTYTGNLGYGVYVLRYTRTYFGADSVIDGDVVFKSNTISKNSGYGAYIYYDAYKQEGGTAGNARVISDASFISNTMSGNTGNHGFRYYKYSRSYYSGYSTLNGTVTADGNTIEDNKGYGIYIYAYAYNYRGSVGNAFISGDIWVRDNKVKRNGGGGVYLYCYSYSYYSKSADIYQNITFLRNTVSNNGYSGFVVTVGAYSNRAVGGDTSVVGDIKYLNNVINANSYHGIYFYRYASAAYTSGTAVALNGDMRVEGNEVNYNYNYAIYIYNSVGNSQAGLTGRATLAADYHIRNNTVKGNLYWAAMYLYRALSAYYTGTATLDSDMILEDNAVSSNRGTGVYIRDSCSQYYYGGAGDPDRGTFTLKGRLDILRNTIETNAGTGLHLNSTIDAYDMNIEPSPRIMHNSISYNGGDYGFYCDLRDITKPITIENNTMESNEVQYVALISNSGTAPDLLFKNNRIRHNTVLYTTLGLVVGDGNYNATFVDNNVSYNDAGQFVLAFISRGKITVERNDFIGNTNATDVVVVRGPSNVSTIMVDNNVLRNNAGNAVNVYTLGRLDVKQNRILGNDGSAVIALTDPTAEVVEATMYIQDNRLERNGGNGVWTIGLNTVEITDNTILDNDLAGIRVQAMAIKPKLTDNTIEENKWGVSISGDSLAPLTKTYVFTNLVIKDSDSEGFYAEDLTVELRSCTVTGSGDADLAVRSARMDCYSTTVGYASGHVYEEGYIRIWWRVDVDVKWQSGVPVRYAEVKLASDFSNVTYRDMVTDVDGHIAPFNVEEWSMVDMAVNRWSPYRCTATKNTESSTQVETVNRSRNILIVLRDAHVPLITISEPLDGALLNKSVIKVAGTASDGGSGLLTVRIRMDNGEWTDLGKAASYSKILLVPDGRHVITVQGEDVAGMLGNATVNITIDTVPPEFMLVYPEEGTLTNTSLIEVEGRVMEAGLEVTVNGLPQTIGSDNVFKETIRLFEGPNVIRVWAKDAAGNTGLRLVNVTLDTVAPMLTIDSPPDHHLTSDPVLTVVGRSEAGASIDVNGKWSTVAVGGGAFQLDINLTEGENLLAVTARDPAGNPSAVYVHVRLDTLPPTLTIQEPKDGLLTREDKVRVVGTVEMEDGLVLSVGGSFVLPADGKYNYTVDLVEGRNLIVVTAKDAAGNTADLNVTVIRRTQPPMLEITRPSYDFMVTNEVSFRIEGVTDADVVLTVGPHLVDVEENGNFSIEVELQSGENVIAVKAEDVLGNVADAVVHLILDTVPPVLIVDWPFDGYTTEELYINVTGRTDVGAHLTLNGEDITIDDKGRFDIQFSLALGRQNITVLALDQAGNDASITLWVERYEPEEPFEPVVPSTAGGSTGTILILLLVLIVLLVLGYMYVQRRRRRLAE